ncbi:MAG: hypothetical protein HY079_00660 [Elusimicrobia bacterium]|nr:hypothetical protein [Elusimicrobiota bacterium]
MRRLLLAVLLAGAAVPARALQNLAGTAGAEFLRLGVGARALGMGEAYTAVADGPDAAYWNPAGLALMRRPEASYSRGELPAGTHHDFLAVGVPLRWAGGVAAVAVTRLSGDSLALVDASNQTRGSFSPHSEAYAFAYGHDFSDNSLTEQSRDYFRESWNLPRVERPYDDQKEPWTGDICAGVAIKGISETLGARSASSFAVDGGGLFRPTDLPELTVAGAVRNVGEKIRFIQEAQPLPVEGAVGASYDARVEDWRFLPSIEAALPYAGNAYGKLGVEVSRRVAEGAHAALRLGYNSRTAADVGPVSGLGAGVGLQVGGFRFDAAFQPMGVLGQALRVGVGWRF